MTYPGLSHGSRGTFRERPLPELRAADGRDRKGASINVAAEELLTERVQVLSHQIEDDRNARIENSYGRRLFQIGLDGPTTQGSDNGHVEAPQPRPSPRDSCYSPSHDPIRSPSRLVAARVPRSSSPQVGLR